MLRCPTITSTIHDDVLIRRGLRNNVRHDGRDLLDFREVEITMERGEFTSAAEVQLGSTRVCCSLRGEVVAPYPDRPADGIIQFNAALSLGADGAGFTNNDVVRSVEKAIRESDAIDTESLCIVGGKHVWLVSCDIRVMDYGGNIFDAAIIGTIVAIKAFRKPDVSVVSNIEGVASVVFHKQDERDPLPLALHHTPLSVSFAIFGGDDREGNTSKGDDPSSSSSSGSGNSDKILLVADPLGEEEAVMDGVIMYSLNGDNELCALYKPGGMSIAPSLITSTLKIASTRALQLHADIDAALVDFEQREERERTRRVDAMQKLTAAKMQAQALAHDQQQQQQQQGNVFQQQNNLGAGGIEKTDEILSWQLLHRPSTALE